MKFEVKISLPRLSNEFIPGNLLDFIFSSFLFYLIARKAKSVDTLTKDLKNYRFVQCSLAHFVIFFLRKGQN